MWFPLAFPHALGHEDGHFLAYGAVLLDASALGAPTDSVFERLLYVTRPRSRLTSRLRRNAGCHEAARERLGHADREFFAL